MATKDVMLDIETLSLQSDALVLSIGAVKFNSVEQPASRPLWECATSFLAVPSLLEQVLLGRHVDQGTQKWWATQPVQAQDHWCGPAVNSIKVYEALQGLAEYVSDADRVWANGIVFDIGILESLYRQFKMSIPWKYSSVRDARTFYDTHPSTRTWTGSEDWIAHHPVGDCKHQIVRLWEHGYTS